MVSSGFFRKSGFIKSCMSSVVHPGKEDTLTSGISRDFMALEVLENRISGNHNFLFNVRLRLRLLALSCRLG